MTASLPLQDKQVLIPRGAKQAKPFSELVRRLGGIPVEIPLLAFRPVAASEELVNKLINIHTYDWVIFTSNVTVETFFTYYKNKDSSFPKVAVIGEKTGKVLENLGIAPAFTPKEYVAEGFVREFKPYVKAGMRILLPKGSLARAYISSALRNVGAIVDEVVIYETYFPAESRRILIGKLNAKKLDILAFTSPSTIDHFMKTVQSEHLEAKMKHCLIACIGPVTKRKAEEYGLPVHACPETYTVEEMMSSMVDYINENERKRFK